MTVSELMNFFVYFIMNKLGGHSNQPGSLTLKGALSQPWNLCQAFSRNLGQKNPVLLARSGASGEHKDWKTECRRRTQGPGAPHKVRRNGESAPRTQLLGALWRCWLSQGRAVLGLCFSCLKDHAKGHSTKESHQWVHV